MTTHLISFTSATENRIDIDATQRATRPVNRRLFGKFAEHLGRNIYNGMWAQILQNTSFSDWSFYRPIWKQIDRYRSDNYPIDRVLSAYERGLSCWWIPYGSNQATYLIDWQNPVTSDTCQRIHIPTSETETGIAQIVYLPAHRTKSYTVQFYARGNAQTLNVSVADENAQTILATTPVTGIGENWQTFTVDLTLPEHTPQRIALHIGTTHAATFWLDHVLLFPNDHISGFDPDVIRLLKESKLPLLRYPGGNFVSGYHWKDGIGPAHKRPVRLNPAWPVVEPNHVGTDEFMAFCKAVGCEPMICVNAGNGTPKEAAQWVEYCNGSIQTEYGKLRAENGHPEPYNVHIWEIGNELYGNWQVGHCTPEEYAERYDAFQKAMRAVDPNLYIVANCQSLDWNRPLVERKGSIVQSLSLHTLIGNGARAHTSPEAVFRALMAHTTTYDDHLQALAQQARQTVADPKIAITELQVFTNVPQLPNNASQTESLFLAGIIHSAMRQGDLVDMITHSALVNHGGGLRKEREVVYPNPVHWVSHLYGNLPEGYLVKTATSGQTFSADVASIATVQSAPVLDAISLISTDEQTLILLIINRDPSQPVQTTIHLTGFCPASKAQVVTLSGESYMAKNTLQNPDAVKPESSVVSVEKPFTLTVPAHSVTVLTLKSA